MSKLVEARTGEGQDAEIWWISQPPKSQEEVGLRVHIDYRKRQVHLMQVDGRGDLVLHAVVSFEDLRELMRIIDEHEIGGGQKDEIRM